VVALLEPIAADGLPATGGAFSWYLTGCLPGQSGLSQTTVQKSPFLIGRDPNADLVLPSRSVSKRHAEISAVESALILRDLTSTNGSYVNGRRITAPTPIHENDLIQLADMEFRLGRRLIEDSDVQNGFTLVGDLLEQGWLISRMQEVLHEGRLKIVFQPILSGPGPKIIGYEALARTDVPGLESPIKLFDAAESLGLEIQLSRRCREEAVRLMDEAGTPGTLFVNTHPCETIGEELLQSLHELRSLSSQRPLVIEVHEESVTNVQTIRAFKHQLHGLGMRLAYDDFGTGQSRLLELAQAPPDYLKFDRSFLKDLGAPDAVHTGLVKTLHQHARQLGIETVAEGLDNRPAAQVCHDIGFTHFQGFLFGKPMPLKEIGATSTRLPRPGV